MISHFIKKFSERDNKRVSRIELPSLPWEGNIIAIIRHPQELRFKIYDLRILKS